MDSEDESTSTPAITTVGGSLADHLALVQMALETMRDETRYSPLAHYALLAYENVKKNVVMP